MKTLSNFLLSACLLCVPVYGQINKEYNRFRTGDILIKQQVEYKNPGKTGMNVIWDFSNLKTVNEEYILSYESPPLESDSIYILGDRRFTRKSIGEDELIIGMEHNTMYYYRLTNDSLLQLGHENPSVEWEYTIPLVLIKFPLNYGKSTSATYQSKGLYSGSVKMQTQGSITTAADAYGRMILPSRDTLKHVLRVSTTQTIYDLPNKYYDNSLNNDKGKQVETCRWYSKGYRYPVFETVRNINLSDSTEIFSTAFFFPPQDHFYLDTDKDNLAVLDSLWNLEHTLPDDKNNLTPTPNLSYNFYPNPVESLLMLEYYLENATSVSVTMYSMDGKLIKSISMQKLDKGLHVETIDCTSLSKGIYILKLQIGQESVNEKIIKR